MVLDFFGQRSWDIDRVEAPWGVRPSIYRHIAARVAAEATSLSRAGVRLPDEDRVVEQSGSGLRWVAGALDGVIGHHAADRDGAEVAQSVLRALEALTEKAADDRVRALYSLLSEHAARGYIDALVPAIAQRTNIRRDRLLAVARWLATESPDREPVKAAIALIGSISRSEDRELLLTLGRHEEFTLFSAAALEQTGENPEPVLWELAQHVTGWGRIHLVERLAATQDARIKAWLLREGCRNDILNEYTALVCAKSGDLVTALRASDPDPPLMKGAGAILAALIRGGPAEGIEGYADGPEAMTLYLAHLRDRDADLEDLNVVATIEGFVAGDRAPVIKGHVEAIKARPDWPEKIRAGLASEDRSLFWHAGEAAKLFGIDTWDVYFDRLQRGEDQWYYVMQTDDASRIDRVVRLAEERLPLDHIASGPADELGLGLEFAPHRALDYVLQDLSRFPGKGWTLIRTGLNSPVTRNRNIALRALAAWDRTTWPADAAHAMRHALEAEPNTDTHEQMRQLLDGEPQQS